MTAVPQSRSQDNAPPLLKPSFLRALRGAWLLNRKSRFAWRRMPSLALSLLVLPTLIYITTSTRRGWTQRQTWLGQPVLDVISLNSRLARDQAQLSPEQNARLNRIFIEEYARTEAALGEIRAGEAAHEARTAEVRAGFARIRERARTVLDDSQFGHLRALEARKLSALERNRGNLWNRTAPFHRWLIDFYFFVILPVGCVASCGSLIREEVQANTLGFLTTRPLTRARLVIVKFISQTAGLQILFLLQALLLFGSGALREVPGLGPLLPLFLGTQFLAVLAWSALGTFLGLLSKRYMALALLYGFVVELGIGRIPTNINSLSVARHLKSLLSRNPTLQGTFEWAARGVPFSITALFLATAVFLAFALALFTFHEYHHTTEMQK